MFKTIEWKNNSVVMIDQRLLPAKVDYIVYNDYHGVADAIRSMVVRGAPAIGVAAGMGIALGVIEIDTPDIKEFTIKFEDICRAISATRPTAVNLFWAVDRMKRVLNDNSGLSISDLKRRFVKEAEAICSEDVEINKSIGRNGSRFIRNGATILTHCNAGALATAGYGTALGVIRAARDEGKRLKVFADETRPFLQGARLTAWELVMEGIDTTLITDNMAGYMMQQGIIDCVVVGADRIAANGDVANKIGTYSVAVLAKWHNVPFYVAAPISTIDETLTDGTQIPIEERSEGEVTHIMSIKIAPDNIKVRNPAFDITPNELISAIITERGVVCGKYREGIKRIVAGSHEKA